MKAIRVIVVLTLACVGGTGLTACGDDTAGAGAAGKFEPKSVNMVIPFEPGGGVDLAGRTVSTALTKENLVPGQIQITNMPGGSGRIGMQDLVTNGRGDANRLLMIATHVVLTPMFQKGGVTYEDLTPLARLFAESDLLVVRDDSPYKTLRDVIEALKRDPASVRIGGASAASLDSVVLGRLARTLGIDANDLKYVSYDGGGATPALLGGHIDVEFGGPDLVDLIRAGKIRALGVTSEDRLSGDLADVPTFKEQDVDLVEGNWRMIFGPPDMPEEAVAFWRDALQKMSETPTWKAALNKYSWEPYFANDGLDAFLSEQTTSFRHSLKSLGLVE
jgi:putative tricarboxylic transport membrane protein